MRLWRIKYDIAQKYRIILTIINSLRFQDLAPDFVIFLTPRRLEKIVKFFDIFVKNRHFCQKPTFFVKIQHFNQKPRFLSKTESFVKNRDFCQNPDFFSKPEIVDKIRHFCQNPTLL